MSSLVRLVTRPTYGSERSKSEERAGARTVEEWERDGDGLFSTTPRPTVGPNKEHYPVEGPRVRGKNPDLRVPNLDVDGSEDGPRRRSYTERFHGSIVCEVREGRRRDQYQGFGPCNRENVKFPHSFIFVPLQS